MASLRPSNALLFDPRPEQEPKAQPAISLSNVTRVFGVVPGLVRADLVVRQGEIVLVRGPNGAGKSTLLRIIATAISPTYGTGRVFGLDLVAGREQIRRRVELLGHRTRLYEDLTARENLRFVCRLYDMDPGNVDEVLERVVLPASEERVRGFSQGMRQRVAVARALLRKPDLLLLDEPYAGLDDRAKEIVDGAIVEASTEGRTVVLATHDPTRGSMANRTLFMDGGRLGAAEAVR